MNQGYLSKNEKRRCMITVYYTSARKFRISLYSDIVFNEAFKDVLTAKVTYFKIIKMFSFSLGIMRLMLLESGNTSYKS